MAYDLNSGTPGRQTVSAPFETSREADKARADLLAAGFSSDDITMGSVSEHHAASTSPSSQSVFKSLLDIFIFAPPHEKPTYEEALRRGGVAIAVRTEAAGYEQAIDILDRDGAMDLDEHETEWKAEGWSPDLATARPGGPGSAAQVGFEDANRHDPLVNPAATGDVRERIGSGTSDMTVGTDLAPAGAVSEGDAAMKRDVSHGRTRIRSYRDAATDMPRGIDPEI